MLIIFMLIIYFYLCEESVYHEIANFAVLVFLLFFCVCGEICDDNQFKHKAREALQQFYSQRLNGTPNSNMNFSASAELGLHAFSSLL